MSAGEGTVSRRRNGVRRRRNGVRNRFLTQGAEERCQKPFSHTGAVLSRRRTVRACPGSGVTSEPVCHCLRRWDEDAGLVHTAESTQQHSRGLPRPPQYRQGRREKAKGVGCLFRVGATQQLRHLIMPPSSQLPAPAQPRGR